MIRVLIAEDHTLVREGIRLLLAQVPDITATLPCIGENHDSRTDR